MKLYSNSNSTGVVDDNENEEKVPEIVKQPKKKKKKSIKGKKGSSLPEYNPIKIEEHTHIEFVLGDYQTFDNLSTFTKMTSLSLINQNIKSIASVINHIPIKEHIIYFCLNENYITHLQGIEQLPNIVEIQMNFNDITEIHPQVSKLNNLKKLWLCENKITKIENLPNAIENLWIANNQIQFIPNTIQNYQHINNLNLSGNLIIDFQDIYNLQSLKNLKCLYLSDINFGDNPLCHYINYREIMIHFFPNIDNLDQIIISPEERKDVSNAYMKKFLFYKNKITHNNKICKMLFRLMKTNILFMRNLKLHQSSFFCQRKKMLDYAKYAKQILKEENDSKIEEIEKEINISNNKLSICLNLMDNAEMKFKCIKKQIAENNNLAIVCNFYEMETNGNFKIEAGNANLKWTKSCIDLFKKRLTKTFLERNKIKGIAFSKVFKFLNKKNKIQFEALYDSISESNGKYGDEKKYYDFLFLILPKEKNNIQSILRIVYEEESESETQMILCDNISEIDEYNYNIDKMQKFTAVICKCINFDNIIDKSHILTQLNNYDTILAEMNKVKTNKEIAQVVYNDISYYLYNIKGLVIPEYLVEYEYTKTNEDNEINNNESEFISSFNLNKLTLGDDYENLFNMCAKDLFSKENMQFYSDEVINKYSTCKFGEFKELDNSIMFFNKNSILEFISKCFKFQNFDEFKREMTLINEKIADIASLKFKMSLMEIIFSKEKREKINIQDISVINLFNLGITDVKFNEFLDMLLKESENEDEIKKFTTNITELLVSKNEITNLNINKIFNVFPNLIKIDISHNKISEISYISTTPSTQIIKLEHIDISFNIIKDFSHIILLLQSINSLTNIVYYGNPFKIYNINFNVSLSDNSLEKNKKDIIIANYNKYISSKENIQNQKILASSDSYLNRRHIKQFDVLFDCYSIGDEYNTFSNIKYFIEKDNNLINFKSLILSKKKLLSFPIIEKQKDIQILYLNLNKIYKIDNTSLFSNLLELYVQNNKISKIENLPQTLIKLDISNNELTSLDGIEQADKLRWLNIENNAIHSIAQLISLSKLNELYSSGNFINNINECYQLSQIPNLEIIDISSNELCIKVTEIRMGMIFHCKKIKNFNRINVDDTEREKANEYFMGRLTTEILMQRLGNDFNTNTLIELDLSSLRLKDEEGMFSLERYSNLKKLNISKNLFKSFAIFGFLPTLLELNMNYNLVNIIFNKNDKKIGKKDILGVPNLQSLEIAGNGIMDINGIQMLKNLRFLVIRENNITKIDALNKMNYLMYIDISFNKLRSVETTNIGFLPSLQIFLCDNNFLKNINAFAKIESIQTLSFENNKISEFFSFNKLSLLEQLRDLNLLNNPVTKITNYRNKMIKLFEKINKLDGSEITNDEREIIASEMQMQIGMNDSFISGLSNQRLTSAYNYNIKRLQDKGLKKVNYVQLDLLNPKLSIGRDAHCIMPNLPHISHQYTGVRIKPMTSELKKRLRQNFSLQKNTNSCKITYFSFGNTQKRGSQKKEFYGYSLSAIANDLNRKISQYFPTSQNKK